MSETYVCAACGGTFAGDPPRGEEVVIVCDGCHNRMISAVVNLNYIGIREDEIEFYVQPATRGRTAFRIRLKMPPKPPGDENEK